MGVFGFTASYLAFSVLHFFEFVLALVVLGLYGQDLNNARQQHKYADSKWVFAEVVGGLAALTALLYMIPFIMRFALVWIWNAVMFILWIAVFGVFGNMYIKTDAQGDSGIQRMKNAVWVDLANALLWLITGVAHFIYWWGHRERHSRFTGRAKV